MIMSNNGGAISMKMNEMVQRSGGGGGTSLLLHQPTRGLKKGPWTAAEDAILMEYVNKHGEGNWNAVQKNSGLARCGKSCRLRWTNHLRPNLKKGSLTPDEERLIIELHAKYGNKWARMASQLPGRTDNEIKNYWNTRTKRRQRAGLSVCPHDFPQVDTDSFRHQQPHEANMEQQHQKMRHNSNSPSSFSSLLSSSHLSKEKYTTTPSLTLCDHLAFDAPLQNHHNSSLYHLSNPMSAQFDVGFVVPLSPVSPFGKSSSALFDKSIINIPNQTLVINTPSQNYYSSSQGGFGNYNLSLRSLIMDSTLPSSYEPLNSEHPFSQTPSFSLYNLAKPVSSANLIDMEANSGNTNDEYKLAETVASQVKRLSTCSGLLDDVLAEAENMYRTKRSRSGDSSSGESGNHKNVVVDEEDDEFSNQNEVQEQNINNNVQEESSNWKGSGVNGADQNQREDYSSSPSIGMKASEDPLKEEMDEDLMNLLNFSSATPSGRNRTIWYTHYHLGSSTNDRTPSNNMNARSDKNASLDGIHDQQNPSAMLTTSSSANTSSGAPADDDEFSRDMDRSCFWNNLPGICSEI